MKTPDSNGPGACAIAALILWVAAPRFAQAQVIVNGGFEAGFASWTRADQLGSNGTFFLQSGNSSPVNGTAVPAPPGGVQAAMTDAQGPGSHVLYQDFVVPSLPIASALLSFDVFIGNRATAFFTPNPASLDFSTPALNQQARVDILHGATDPFSVLAADVVVNAYQSAPGNPLVSGYNTIAVDVTSALVANAGGTLRLRFAEVDNVFTFQMGVDRVSLTVSTVPEPSSIVLIGMATSFGLYRIGRRCGRRPGTSVARSGVLGYLGVATIAVVMAPSMASAQILLGHIDTFQDGTVAGWTEGVNSPNPPVNVVSGGPAGVGDHYLQNVSTGGFGAGSKMVMFNTAQWTGNYVNAGVNRITAQMANFGATTLHMRVAIQGGPSFSEYGSAIDKAILPDGLWHSITFDLSPSAMALIAGSDSLALTLMDVVELRILSAAGGPSFNGDPIAATLGVDNIRATRKFGFGSTSVGSAVVPEPNSIAFCGVAVALLLGRFGLPRYVCRIS